MISLRKNNVMAKKKRRWLWVVLVLLGGVALGIFVFQQMIVAALNQLF